mmetsp:Transcript_76428/g.151209  ORF Transcript_76428/g.151209 Transcript_76428/m.151209 type:complete len:439 (+) Transcript_76428:69-1385(+)
MAIYYFRRSHVCGAQAALVVVLFRLGDGAYSMSTTSLFGCLQAETCRASSTPLQDLWLPHVTWAGLPSHVMTSHDSQEVTQRSASMLQTKSTVRNDTHATSPTDMRQWINQSSQVEHVASHARPTSLAAVPLVARQNVSVNHHFQKTVVAGSRFVLPTGFITVIKSLCIFSNVLGQLSPIPQVRQFYKNQDTGEADAAPFVSIMYGGLQWSFYGFFAFVVTRNADVLVLVYSNMVGAILGFYYVHGFYQNCCNEQFRQRLSVYCKVAATLAGLQLLATTLFDMREALLFCGLVSCVSGMMSAVSLLTTMPQVLHTRCSSSINLPLLSTGMFGASSWLICGFLMHDVWIMLPNVVSLVFQSCAAAAVIVFPREQDEPLLNSRSKHTEAKMVTKDVVVTKAAPSDFPVRQLPMSKQGATGGDMPDDYGSLCYQQGGTGST